MTQQELENLVKSASDKMRSDDNTKGVTKYLEHFSWLLFLRLFEQVEDQAEMVAEMDKRSYERTVSGDYRWSAWTQRDLTGPELVDFVTTELLPHLRQLAGTPEREKVAEIFNAVSAVMKSGYVLAEVIAVIDKVSFATVADYHAMSVIYERLLAEMGGDASWSGEFYTPRPVVELMVAVTRPKLKERIYDPCSGSCGFLVSTFEHIKGGADTLAERALLQQGTLFGKEAGELPFLLGTMNMMLHGILAPNNLRTNTLEEDVSTVAPDAQYDVVLTNPPFGGRENPQVQQNFQLHTSATEVLFLQHIVAMTRGEGRVAVVAPDGVLFDDETAFKGLRRKLLTDCNLHTIVRLPVGAFPNTPHQRLNLLFFDRKGPSQGVWFYEHLVPENRRHLKHPRYNKSNPLCFEELEPLLAWWDAREPNDHAWYVPADEIEAETLDLDLHHPDRPPKLDVVMPSELRMEIDETSEALRDFVGEIVGAGQELDGALAAAQELVSLDSLGVKVNPENHDPREDGDGEFLYVDLSAVDRGAIAMPEPLANAKAPSRARRVVRTGDVLFSMVRSYLRGHAVIPEALDGAIASTGFAVLCPPEGVLPDWLLLQLLAPRLVQQCLVAKGAHYPALRVDQVKALTVPVPPSEDSQQQLVDEVWPRVSAIRTSRLGVVDRLTELLDSIKDSEFSLLALGDGPSDG
ncbi:MAG TPA: N-6 DNA methylase [Solirubrobacteraceae bacterium]|jgi:type I restriction enzyme M protein|nr:N-6 DNA methylase [Solirubrobacteraceae bacterium]